MSKIKHFLVFLLISCYSVGVLAQKDYTLSAGARLGPSGGITVKGFMNDNSSVEGLLTIRWGGLNLTGLYELNQTVLGTEMVNFYYGVGAHVGYWNGVKEVAWFEPQDGKVMVGLDGIIGIELTFSAIPFNMSLDWKPAFNIAHYTGAQVDEIGLSIRYIITR